MANIIPQLNEYRLTTAELLYRLPDHPTLLQSYIWQDYDRAPDFPTLLKFIDFWQREIDGKLHTVLVKNEKIITAGDFSVTNIEISWQ
jgi:uncharacterized protein Usg